MRIRYIAQVDSPWDQAGKVGDTRDVSDYIGDKLVRANYAVDVTPKKGKTDGTADKGAIAPKETAGT